MKHTRGCTRYSRKTILYTCTVKLVLIFFMLQKVKRKRLMLSENNLGNFATRTYEGSMLHGAFAFVRNNAKEVCEQETELKCLMVCGIYYYVLYIRILCIVSSLMHQKMVLRLCWVMHLKVALQAVDQRQ